QLLRSLEDQGTSPYPSVHLALRLSTNHDLGKEKDHLNSPKTNEIESSLANGEPVLGRLALYPLALKASCHDINTLTFTVNHRNEYLLTLLKRLMEREKEHIVSTILSNRPLSNYYQSSLCMLALCVSGVRVKSHVSNKLTNGVEHGHIKQGDSDCINMLAMAGKALQCMKEFDAQVQEAALDKALDVIKQNAGQAVLVMTRPFSRSPKCLSGALLAMGSQVKGMQCCNENDSLFLEATTVQVTVLLNHTKVALKVEVVKLHSGPEVFFLNSFKSRMLASYEFIFEKENCFWGRFLSMVNGEWARQTDNRY
uniref:Transcobalamin II n=1 Tax=Esox lucius TaxID=8010 RepID=A0A3P8YAJ3_ESOLU